MIFKSRMLLSQLVGVLTAVSYAACLNAATVTGIVTDSGGNPLENVYVQVSSPGCNWGTSIGDTTDGSGSYTILNVTGATQYKIEAADNDSNPPYWVQEYMDDADGTQNCNDAGTITTDDDNPSEVDFQLERGAFISGQVLGTGGENVCINAMTPETGDLCGQRQWKGGAGPDQDGNYSMIVPAGTFFLEFDPSCGNNPNNLRLEYWTNDGAGTTDCNSLHTFTLAADGLTTKNITLDNPAAILSGKITDGNDQPIAGLIVEATVPGCMWNSGYQGTTDALGDYSIAVPPDTELQVRTCGDCTTYSAGIWLDEFWTSAGGTQDCNNTESFIPTTDSPTVKNFSLMAGTIINGNIAGLNNGEGACIGAYALPGTDTCMLDNRYDGNWPDNSGNYSLVVPPGKYVLEFSPDCDVNSNNLIAEFWTNGGGATDCADAESFDLVANDIVTKDILLDSQAAIISGNVTDSNDQPIGNLRVSATDFGCDSNRWYQGTTDSNGNYSIAVPPDADYKVGTCADCNNYAGGIWLDEYWDGAEGTIDCFLAGKASPTVMNQVTADFKLEPGIEISGNVTGTDGQNVCIMAFTLVENDTCNESQFVSETWLRNNETYSFVVPEGTYFLSFDPSCGSNPNNVTKEYWINGGEGTTDCALANTFTLALGDPTTDRNIKLDSQAAIISGRVTDGSDQPIAGLTVEASEPGCGWGTIYDAITDENGEYTIAVPPGVDVKVGTWYNGNNSVAGYWIDEFWNNAGGSQDCNEASTVTPTLLTPVIANFVLEGGALISGIVSGADNENVCATAYELIGGDTCNSIQWAGGNDTGNQASYNFIVPAGTYFFKFDPNCGNNSNHLMVESWTIDGEGTTDCSLADTLTVAAGDDQQVDINLNSPGAVISGNIAGADGENVCINAMVRRDGGINGCDTNWAGGTGAVQNGDFSFTVPPGDYYLATSPCSNDPSYLIHESWSTAGDTTHCSGAEMFTAVAGTNPSRNFTLNKGGRIEGFLFGQDGSTPISNESNDLEVGVYTGNPCDYNEIELNNTWVDFSTGAYTLPTLAPGNYSIKVNGATNHANGWWTTSGISIDCSLASPITVAFETTADNKNFSLPTTADDDGDNLSNIDEAHFGTDKDKRDTDDDGLNDEIEVSLFQQYYQVAFDGDLDLDGKTNINDTDMDGDGVSDLQELARGSDAADKNSKPADLVLYDDFSSNTLDSSKWKNVQSIRETIAGALHLGLTASGVQRNYVQLLNAPEAGAVKTLVTLSEMSGTAIAGIGGIIYNTQAAASDLIGAIDASLWIGDTTGEGLQAIYNVAQSDNADGAVWTTLTDNVVIPNLSQPILLGSTFCLELIHDGANNITFNIYAVDGIGQETIIGSASYTGPAWQSNYGAHRTLKNKVFNGKMTAVFDNVETGTTSSDYSVYDDFSTTRLDQNKWSQLERTVQITAAGTIRLLAHGDNDTTARTYLELAKHYPYVEATVVIDPASWLTVAQGRSQLMLDNLFNTVRGPGSGLPYNGLQNDVGAGMTLRKSGSEPAYANFSIYHMLSDSWNVTEGEWGQFLMEINKDIKYKMFVGFTKDFIVTGLEDLTDINIPVIEAIITPIEDVPTQYLPSYLHYILRSRVDAGNGEGTHISFYDDVYVGGEEIDLAGDVNVDRAVDLKDAILSLKAMSGSTPNEVWFHGDMNGDDKISLPDVLGIMEQIAP